MPILEREPDIFPDDLLERPAPPAESEERWWALYTRSRREKDLMRRLRGLEIPFYGPVIQRRFRSPSGRRRVSHVPLFAGYVFLLGDPQQREDSLRTNCVSDTLPVSDAEELVRDLQRIQQLIRSEAALTPEARLERGMRVRIRTGPLAGIEGVVIRRRGQDRLLVAVTFLQQGASLLLDDFQVERID